MASDYEAHFEKLRTIVHGDREEIVETLSELLKFATVSGAKEPEAQGAFRAELSRGFAFLNELASRMGFVWRDDGRVCVIEQPGGDEVVGAPLHLDVVPPGEGWRHPPFAGVVENGVVYGRGAQDDKGPIAAMLYALYALKRLDLPFRRTVRLIVASQEETGQWDDVEAYLAREAAPDFSIVSDSEFPIVNGEKGMVDLDFAFRWDAPESRGELLRFERLASGERSNVVPDRAEIVWTTDAEQVEKARETLASRLETFLREHPEAAVLPLQVPAGSDEGTQALSLTFMGKSAHGSLPQDGHNAAVDALGFLAAAPGLPAPVRETARFLARATGDHYGEGLNLAAEHDFIGKTTVNLGVLRIGADSALATVNVRPTYGVKSQDVLETARSVLDDRPREDGVEAGVAFGNRPYEPLFVDPERHPELIGALQKAFTRVTGAEATLTSMGGSTFAKAFPNAVCFGPVHPAEESKLAHQANECVRVEHLMRNVEIYALALMLLACEL